MVVSGWLGRKRGCGFYNYRDKSRPDSAWDTSNLGELPQILANQRLLFDRQWGKGFHCTWRYQMPFDGPSKGWREKLSPYP